MSHPNCENLPTLGLYIHIPFCRSKCDYCDFYSLAGREGRMAEYQRALLTHINRLAPLARGYQVDTVYFGGGTPSFYGAERLVELLEEIRRGFTLAANVEITLEGNPDSVNEESLSLLRRGGFNRLSMGMQSGCQAELSAIHRPHTAGQTDRAVEAARKAGFENLSLDLIYGLPGQTMESWEQTVEHALSLKPNHLSCYGLKVEEGTPLAKRVAEGELLPDDDLQADLYLWTVERLERGGYTQYEISNFAPAGYESRHNLKYWNTQPYMGFGPGAHSDFGGRRYSHVRDLDGYIRTVLAGEEPVDEEIVISRQERGAEYVMLRMRTAHGMEESEFTACTGMDFAPLKRELEEYARRGLAVQNGARWRFTPEGFLLSNLLIGRLLEAGGGFAHEEG